MKAPPEEGDLGFVARLALVCRQDAARDRWELIWFIWSVWSIWFNRTNETDRTCHMDKAGRLCSILHKSVEGQAGTGVTTVKTQGVACCRSIFGGVPGSRRR
jgi:hypothetical protein